MTGSGPPIAEQLAEALSNGTWLDLIPDVPFGTPLADADMRSWEVSHEIDAGIVRDVLLRRTDCDPDPRGLMLRGARILGVLDLSHLDTRIVITLADCLLDSGVDAEHAHLAELTFARCQLGLPDRPRGLSGEQLHVEGRFRLDGSRISAANVTGAVRISGARVGGTLSFSGATVRNPIGPAVMAEVVQANQNVFLHSGFAAEGAGEGGTICLLGARVGGQLNLGNARLQNLSGPALLADGVQIDGALFLDQEFTAEGVGKFAAVRLSDARIGGGLSFSGAAVRNPSGPAVRADRLRVGGDLWINKRFTADGIGDSGAVSLSGAQVGGLLSIGRASIRNKNGPALGADDLQVDGSLIFQDGFIAVGAGSLGAIRLLEARVGGEVRFDHALVRNDSGPALGADRLQANGGLFVREGFIAQGVGAAGAVRLPGARVSGQVQFGHALICNLDGPALIADNLHAARDVIFYQGFVAVAEGIDQRGAVRLTGSQIDGQLRLGQAAAFSLGGPALSADRLRVAKDLSLSQGFVARGGGECGTVILRGTEVSGQFRIGDVDVTSRSGVDYRWEIDGLTYNGVPWLSAGTRREDWVELLDSRTPAYAAQPYQQLAAAYRAEGHDSDVRFILMAQRRDQMARGRLSWNDHFRLRFSGLLLGFGYQTWRAFLCLAAALVISVTLAFVLGAHGALVKVAEPPSVNNTKLHETCPPIEIIGRGLDLGTPFLPTASASCKVTTGSIGVIFTSMNWALRFVAWALTALFFAGFTSVVRKT